MPILTTLRRLAGRAARQFLPRPPAVPPASSFLIRNALRHYIAGRGIEVGALHQPLDLSGLNISQIQYVDRLTETELARRYPELRDFRLTHVDIVDDGEVLSRIENGSLDFIIGNHFIEHTRNPIATLSNWLSKLRPGGILFMAVPDKRHTFDVDRELTPLAHLTRDAGVGPAGRQVHDRQHFVEWATHVDKTPAPELEARVNFLVEIDYSIHFHTFTLQSFLELVTYMRQELNAPLELKACADVFQETGEFLVILGRTGGPAATRTA